MDRERVLRMQQRPDSCAEACPGAPPPRDLGCFDAAYAAPPAPKLSEPGSRLRWTVGDGRRRAGWQPGLAPPYAPGEAPPGEVSGYDLQPSTDPNCPGWVAVPRYELEQPPAPEGPGSDAERATLPAGHDLTLPPPPTREDPAAAPPPVEETLRPVEVGRVVEGVEP